MITASIMKDLKEQHKLAGVLIFVTGLLLILKQRSVAHQIWLCSLKITFSAVITEIRRLRCPGFVQIQIELFKFPWSGNVEI